MKFQQVADRHLSLFVLPLVILLYSFIRARYTSDWATMAFAVWIVVSLVALLLSGLFWLLNRYWFRMRINWWENFLISMGLILVALGLLLVLVRAG